MCYTCLDCKMEEVCCRAVCRAAFYSFINKEMLKGKSKYSKKQRQDARLFDLERIAFLRQGEKEENRHEFTGGKIREEYGEADD